MTITDAQRAALLVAAKPLIQWLNANAHPHCLVLVGQGTVELTESVTLDRIDPSCGIDP